MRTSPDSRADNPALFRAGVPLRGRQVKGRSSNPRYGTRAARSHRVDDIVEQRVINTVLDMRNEGISFPKIARFLSGAGVPTKTRQKKWHPEVVRQIYLQSLSETQSDSSTLHPNKVS